MLGGGEVGEGGCSRVTCQSWPKYTVEYYCKPTQGGQLVGNSVGRGPRTAASARLRVRLNVKEHVHEEKRARGVLSMAFGSRG